MACLPMGAPPEPLGLPGGTTTCPPRDSESHPGGSPELWPPPVTEEGAQRGPLLHKPPQSKERAPKHSLCKLLQIHMAWFAHKHTQTHAPAKEVGWACREGGAQSPGRPPPQRWVPQAALSRKQVHPWHPSQAEWGPWVASAEEALLVLLQQWLGGAGGGGLVLCGGGEREVGARHCCPCRRPCGRGCLRPWAPVCVGKCLCCGVVFMCGEVRVGKCVWEACRGGAVEDLTVLRVVGGWTGSVGEPFPMRPRPLSVGAYVPVCVMACVG